MTSIDRKSSVRTTWSLDNCCLSFPNSLSSLAVPPIPVYDCILVDGSVRKSEVKLLKVLHKLKMVPGMEISQVKCLVNLGELYSRTGAIDRSKQVVELALLICDSISSDTEEIRKRCADILIQLQQN